MNRRLYNPNDFCYIHVNHNYRRNTESRPHYYQNYQLICVVQCVSECYCWYRLVSVLLCVAVCSFYARLANCEIRLLASSCLSVCPFVCPHGSIRLKLDGFSWYLIFEYISKNCRKIQIPLKSGKNNGYFTWRAMHFYDTISLNFSWNVKYFRQNL
jgi:hypothetical protein